MIRDLEPLGSKPSLNTVWLSYNPITSIKPLWELPSIQNVKVNHTAIKDAEELKGLLKRRLPRAHGGDPGGMLTVVDASGTELFWRSGYRVAPEILRTNDAAALFGLLVQAARGPVIVRTVMIGKGMNGKTALARHLVRHANRFRLIPVSDRTVGTHQVGETALSGERAWPTVPQLILIDCGGQLEQLLANHNLVYAVTSRTLFILCLHIGKHFNGGQDTEETAENWAEYYLGMVQALANEQRLFDSPVPPKVPVLIVPTHADLPPERRRLELPDLAELKQRFPGLDIEIAAPFDGYRGDGLEQVRSALTDLIDRQPLIRTSMPPNILQLRAIVRQDFEADLPSDVLEEQPPKVPIYTLDDFGERCASIGISAPERGSFLASLQAIGDVIVPGSIDAASSLNDVKWILNPRFVNRYVWRGRSACFKALVEAEKRPKTAGQQRDFELVADYFLCELPALSDKTRSVILSTFTSMIDVLQRGVLRDLFTQGCNIDPTAIERGKIIVVAMPLKEYGQVGLYAAALWKYAFQKSIERRDTTANPRPVVLWADEGQFFLLQSTDMLFTSTARSSRVCNVLLTQSISGVIATLGGGPAGKAEADAYLSNYGTKVFHANTDAVSNEYAATLIGRCKQFVVNASSSYQNPMQGFGSRQPTGGSSGLSEIFELEVQPREFSKLRTGGGSNAGIVDAIVFRNGARFGGSGRNWMKVSFKQDLKGAPR